MSFNSKLKNKFNDILQELNSIDITEVEKHQETLENAALAEEKLINLIKNFVRDVKFDDTSRNN